MIHFPPNRGMVTLEIRTPRFGGSAHLVQYKTVSAFKAETLIPFLQSAGAEVRWSQSSSTFSHA